MLFAARLFYYNSFIMAHNRKEQYKEDNIAYLENLASKNDIKKLSKGVLYKIIQSGNGNQPKARSVISVYYKGSLINGKTFDDNTKQGYPDAFRLHELIEGWKIALQQMHEGDKWQIFIPSEVGYGKRGVSGIPGDSTLIFEIELVKVQ